VCWCQVCGILCYQMKRTNYKKFDWLPLITVLLLLYTGISFAGLLHFPPFIDEGLHIGYAQRVLTGRILAGGSDARLLVPILLAPFNPSGAAQLFIGRAVTVLFSLITIALIYSITRKLANRSAAFLATVLAVLCPYLLFYQRMVLIDGYTTTAGLLALWLVLQSKQGNWWKNGVLCGLALALAVGIKGTGVVFLAIPAIALIVDWRGWKVRWLIVCYAIFGAIWIPLFLLLRSRGISYFGLAESVSATQGSIFSRFLANLGAIWEIDAAYLSIPFLILFILGALWWLVREPRRAGMVLLSLVIPMSGILALSPLARARWLIPHIPLLIIAGVIGIDLFLCAVPLRRLIPVVVAGVWFVGVFLPFYLPLQRDPASLPLSATDRQEYITADSAGFALKDVADYLKQNAPTSKTVGMLANCVGLTLYLPETLECPLITWDGSQQATIANRVNELAKSEVIYVVLENLPYITAQGITAPMESVAMFERPGGTSKLTIYRVGNP